MDFSSKNKRFLEAMVDELQIEVNSKGKKPTKDELIVALEKVDEELIKMALETLKDEVEDEEEEEVDEVEDEVEEEVDEVEDEVEEEVQSVYGYKKGDKDPTTYNVVDPEYGHVDGPRHREWKKVNG